MAERIVDQIGSPGILRDTPAHRLPDAAWTDGENVRFGEDGMESLVGDQSTFSSATITPLWIGYFPPIGDPRWVYGSNTELWCYQTTSHTEITRISGNYTGSAGNRWQACMFNGVGIFNNGIDLPQQWTDIDSSTRLTDLSNWTSTRRAESIKPYKNFLVALNMTDSSVNRPYRVVWSDSADVGTVPGSWDTTDPTTDSREFDLAQTSDYLVDQMVLGDINIIYKENSTWGMQYIGPPFYFRFWKILSENGILFRDCVANVPFGQVVVTQNDMIVHSGQVEQFESVLNRKQRNALFSSIDPDNFYNSYLVSDWRKKEVYFFYPESGSTYANRVLSWNWDEKSIGTKQLTATVPFCSMGPVGGSVVDAPGWDEA